MKPCGFEVGLDKPFFLIAGPCVVESESVMDRVADALAALALRRGLPVCFKASFYKANRARLEGARGPGLEEGLRALERVRARSGLPVLTAIHAPPAINHAVRLRRENLGLSFVPHDLRRTAASHMTGMGIPRLVVSKILNHVERGVTAVYDRHSYDLEKRQATGVVGSEAEGK